MRPFRFIAECQSLEPCVLFEKYGVRVFDFRVIFNNNGSPGAAHGLFSFKCDIMGELDKLNTVAEGCEDRVYVRIINERAKNKDYFFAWCMTIVNTYPNLTFFGGNDKKTWDVLYDFGNNLDRELIDKYSSCNYDNPNSKSGNKLDDLAPFMYARCNNEKWREYYKDQEIYLFQDFIGKY